jgi:uncharacterized protein (TIGR04255 family)
MKSATSKGEFEYYENAPIILSILQFRYKKKEKIDISNLKKKGLSISSEYPQIRERFIQQIHFEGNKPDGTTNVSLDEKEIDGVQLISKDKRKNLVIGKDRFTYEMHGKYSGWDDFTSEAKKLWEIFQDELSGVELTGLSLRYVNRINLPLDFHDISEYFTTFIQSSTGNHTINTFQLRFTSVEPKDNITIHVGHVLEPPIEDKYPYLFDIDVIYTSPIDNEPEKIWDIFYFLRDKKNFIFNDGLSKKSKELIRK